MLAFVFLNFLLWRRQTLHLAAAEEDAAANDRHESLLGKLHKKYLQLLFRVKKQNNLKEVCNSLQVANNMSLATLTLLLTLLVLLLLLLLLL